jgi:hypothetical protein
MKSTTSLINHDSQSLIAKIDAVFILCERCYWCATYFGSRRQTEYNNCPQCNANHNQLTSFPIVPNESFTFGYSEKRGVEMQFKHR